ncbi:GTPase [Ruminococcus sp.]|uniref:YcjF family protein n=1 Tax=Ruminococcus sp. TaxID=41978 RepID=UPI0025D3EBF0|nr:GTPase [Ruminococcus sp.]MBQ8965640.1 50S ribosome-binding GTPase [Ruminococcus sp.]
MAMIMDDIFGYAKDIRSRIAEEEKRMGHFNIIVTGKTGVGKSTLLNAVFREGIAVTGIGRPVTRRTRMIEKQGVPLRIFDTKGLELGGTAQEAVKADIFELIDWQLKTKDPDKFIHAIWYCINTTSDRIEEEEIRWINELATKNGHDVPVIIALTKTISRKKGLALKSQIENMNINVRGVVPLLASPYEVDIGDEVKTVQPFGLTELVGVTLQVVPESAANALINAQNVDIGLKGKRARKWLAGFAGTNFAAGFTPFPIADAPILITTEITMLAKMTTIFGIDMDKGMLAAVVSAIVGCSGATFGGRAAAVNLIKLIPGAGTVAGGLINGATAAAFTVALGEAYIAVMTRIARGELKREQMSEQQFIGEIKDIFMEKFTHAKLPVFS